MLLSQHRVLLSKTVRPRAPCGARCIGHAVRTWSVVCSEAPHSQFGEGKTIVGPPQLLMTSVLFCQLKLSDAFCFGKVRAEVNNSGQRGFNDNDGPIASTRNEKCED